MSGDITPEVIEMERTHLRAPISQIVHRHDIPSASLVQICQKSANDGRAEVSDVEALRDVRRRVLDHDFLARAGRVRAILGLARWRVMREPMDLRQHGADEGRCLEHEMQERLVMCDRLDVIVRLELHAIDTECGKRAASREKRQSSVSRSGGKNIRVCSRIVHTPGR